MEDRWNCFILIFFTILFHSSYGQDNEPDAALLKVLENCNGVYLSYVFNMREKEFPYLKNATAQAWAFNSTATIINTGTFELESWEVFVGFQHKELLVSVSGGSVSDATEYPVDASNGTTFIGDDLQTSILTAGDYNQISSQIEISGTQFGVKPPAVPMPKTIKLVSDKYECPKPKTKGKTKMEVCCKRSPKADKIKPAKAVKFRRPQDGDLVITYDVIKAYASSYIADVTIENKNPLGRLDYWNLTWEWQYDEFINTIRGAYVRVMDPALCINGPQGKAFGDMDFSQVISCDKHPIISDLPPTMINDTKLGKIPFCCRNGSVLPPLMDESKSKSAFQLEVYKLPPKVNRSALDPPKNWKIVGVLNPHYKCANPIRVPPTEFPNPYGLDGISYAFATWQVICNITRPKKNEARCCVSFSAYYNESAIPCNTCACGCEDETSGCSQNAKPMLLPPEALLVPFANRSAQAIAWAKLKKFKIPKPRPCPDNCPVSINWHVNTDYKTGWTARITLFNWDQIPFEDWFAAFELDKAYRGYENVYSFNGTKLPRKKTIFLQGLKGLNYLMGETNGSSASKPRVPGKQQSVISFLKKRTPGIKVAAGDGFPSRVYFNGEECALPNRVPVKSRGHKAHYVNLFVLTIVTGFTTWLLDHQRF
ncbi:COBRA-like protein 10 precursor [Euphorbia peplus]|nr:COBRA-like protein 10 precursor [Euphorbia peplus]